MQASPAALAAALVFGALLLPLNSSAQDRALTRASSYADSLSAESKHTYSLSVGQNRYVYGFVDQISVDVVVRILGSDGDLLYTFDSPARGPESFQFLTSEADTYTIEVTPFEKAEGRYSISLVTDEPRASRPARLVDQLMQPYSGDDRPGAVVSVLKDGKVVLARGYGMANLTNDVAMTKDTGMSVASVSKQFTAMAILLLQQDGKLKLDDDIRKHIPELKDFGTPVTLRNMLNHTSGYREVLNFLPMAGWSSTDAMTRDVPIRIVQRQATLQNAPGAEYNYNNTTFMLLATVVERVSGMGFREFMEQRIFQPLGMTNTTIKTHQGQVIPNSSQGYSHAREGGYSYVTDFASAYGASGVNSTASDMTRWMLNYRDATVGGEDAIRQLTTRGVLVSGDTTGYALGLGVRKYRGQTLYSHSGGETSHRSILVYFPEIESGIFLSSNHPAFNRGMWTDIAEAFFSDSFESEPEAEAEDEPATDVSESKPTAAQLEAIAGTYRFVGAPLLIDYTVENGALFAQATNQPRFSLRATSDSTFTFVGVEASVTFHYESDGSVKRGTHHQGPDTPLEKIDKPALTPDQLRAYEGRYISDELETIYTISLGDDGRLMAHHIVNEAFPLTHNESDSFSGGAWYLSTIEFHRDPSGAVSGFMGSNTRTRSVWFRKLIP